MKDLIDRQTAIDAVQEELNKQERSRLVNIWTTAEVRFTIVELILKQLPTVQPERWIPCSKRLPESEKPVLVTGIYGAVFIAIRKYDPIYEDYIWWHSEHGKVEVKAWMPLQEPYEEEKE